MKKNYELLTILPKKHIIVPNKTKRKGQKAL